MNSSRLALFIISAVFSYAACIYKACHVRRGWGDLVYMTLMATLVLQSLTFTMGAAATGFPNLLGVGNSAILLLHLTAVAYCVAAQILLLQWAEPLAAIRGGIRNWMFFGLGTNALLVLLFIVSDAANKSPNVFTTGSSDPLVFVYLLVFIISQTIPCVTIFWRCLSYARLTDRFWLRRALRVLAAGSVSLFLYCATRTVIILASAVGFDLDRWGIVPSVFSGLGIIIVSVGLTMPSWGPRLSDTRLWVRNCLSYRTLHPLWSAVCQEAPEIVLEPPNTGVSNLHYRLHRRVVEIRDGWRALRPYMDAVDAMDADAADTAGPAEAVSAPCASPDPKDDQAFAEAVRIRNAIRAKRDGHAPDRDRPAGAFEERNAATLADEVSWLTKVSTAYARLPAHGNARRPRPEVRTEVPVSALIDTGES